MRSIDASRPGSTGTTLRSPALQAWRQLLDGAPLAGDSDPDGTAAALVRRWHQHFAVAIDAPMERAASGAERLPEIVGAWLDLARRTEPVRAHIARTAGARAAAEQARQDALLLGLLREDLALIGAPHPREAAVALLAEMAQIAAAEDAAAQVLPAHRTAALRAAGLATPAVRRRPRRCPLLRRRARSAPAA